MASASTLQADIDRALDHERLETIAAATGVRAAGSVAFVLLIEATWRITGGRDWLVYIQPLFLYAVLSCVLYAFRRHRLARVVALFAVLLDVWVVEAVQLDTMPLSPFPAGVAGFSLGIFGLLMALNALTMRGPIIYLAATVSIVAQCELMQTANVAVAPMVAAAFVLLLEARALDVLVHRLRRFLTDLAGAEVDRQVQQHRFAEIEEGRRTIEAMLATARVQNDELRQLQDYKGRLSQLLVHDLRAPLTVVTTNVSLMDRRLKRLSAPDDLSQTLDPIRRAVKRLTAMIDDILAISKLEDHQLELHRALLPITGLVDFVAQELERLRPKTATPFEVSVSEELNLEADENLLKRVLENLASNAIRYAPEDTPIAITARREKDLVVLGVHNQGAAIDPEVRGRLFERYQQANGTQGGWGLGLYFCRLAVEAHGGTIAVEDVEGWTTSFIVRLPAPICVGATMDSSFAQ